MLTLALTLLLTFYSSPAAAIHATDERRVQVHGHQNRQQRRKQQSLRSVEAFQLDAGSDADEGWFERYSVCNKRISKNFLSRKYQGKSEANCQACLTGDGACAYVVNGDRAACRLKHKLNTAQARAGAGGTFVGSPLCCHNIMQKTPQQNTQCSQRQEAVHVLQRTQLMGLANPRKSAPDLVAAAIDAAKKNIPTDQGARRTFEDALAATVTFTGLTLSKGGSSLEAIRAIEAGSQIAGVLEQTAQATEVAVPVVGVVLGFVTDGLALARGKSYLQLVEDTLQQLKTAATTMSSERGNARAVAHVEMPVTLEAAMGMFFSVFFSQSGVTPKQCFHTVGLCVDWTGGAPLFFFLPVQTLTCHSQHFSRFGNMQPQRYECWVSLWLDITFVVSFTLRKKFPSKALTDIASARCDWRWYV